MPRGTPALAPHIKGIKTPALLRLLEVIGARGFTCSKLGEAEALAEAGFDDILIANQTVGEIKIARLLALLHRGVNLTVSVDDPGNAAALGQAAVAGEAEYCLQLQTFSGHNAERCPERL